MMCAWKELIDVLPRWMVEEADKLKLETPQEIRIRTGQMPEIVTADGYRLLPGTIKQEDLSYCINAASRYSPWSAATLAQGYLTLEGGHRIGVCGEAVEKDGLVTGFRTIHSMNIRIARDFHGICGNVWKEGGSILILGPPGWGKTTLLRDLARAIGSEKTVGVVDERGELFPKGFQRGMRMDILTGTPKNVGIGMLIRTMTPEWIAVDEITQQQDCRALLQAQGCGVKLLATAHASDLDDLRRRPVYQPLIEQELFEKILVLQPDKSFRTERVDRWKLSGSARY